MNVVVGWAGGPAAIALEQSAADLESRAVSSLASTLDLDRRRVARHIVASFAHDWGRDPFSRGAYSYPLVGGADAARQLARPVRRTLFFAGEASEAEGRTATVHGAIATGYRAAEQTARALAHR